KWRSYLTEVPLEGECRAEPAVLAPRRRGLNAPGGTRDQKMVALCHSRDILNLQNQSCAPRTRSSGKNRIRFPHSGAAMPETDPAVAFLDRVTQVQKGAEKVRDSIPVPEPYRPIVASWLSLEVILYCAVSSVLGPGAALVSTWFYVPTLVLSLLHLLRA